MQPPSDTELQLLRTAIELVFGGILAWFQKRHNNRSEAAAKKAQTTAESTHILVNNKYGVLLDLFAKSQERIAELTNQPADAMAAAAARAAADHHDESQNTMNRYKSDLESK